MPFIMDTLLQSVVKGGTGGKAYQAFKRDDLYGKTGTTNDSIDTWFAGFQPTMTAIAWMGYDTPRSLGDKETGSSLSLPIWISFMETAIRGVPVTELQPPDGVVHVGGEWYYEDFAPGSGLANPWGVSAPVPVEVAPPAKPEPPSDERSRIMDLFLQLGQSSFAVASHTVMRADPEAHPEDRTCRAVFDLPCALKIGA